MLFVVSRAHRPRGIIHTKLAQMERKSETSFSYQSERSTFGCLDCNLRLVSPKMELEIQFSIAKSGFRLVKRNATKRAVAMFDHDSKISCHAHQNNHKMDFGSARVVGHEANFHERLFLGSLVFYKGSTIWKWPHRHPRSLQVSGTRISLALRFQETSRGIFLSARSTCFLF